MTMTFHESYGELPKSTLRLIKSKNITPAEYMLLEMKFGTDFKGMENFIRSYSLSGIYRPPLYM